MKEREENIAAYAAGLMTPEEREDFEGLLNKDETLLSEVEAYRRALAEAQDWLALDAPGIEKLDSIRIPAIQQAGGASRKAKIISIAKQFLAAAAILVLGFFIGRTSGNIAPQPPSPVKQASLPAPEAPTAKPQPENRRIIRENGNVVIETTGAQAETRSIWVVDGSVRLAQANIR